MQVPWRQLPTDVLDRLLEEIVSRDGTDYGASELALAEKVARARRELESGRAILTWDSELATGNLVRSDRRETQKQREEAGSDD